MLLIGLSLTGARLAFSCPPGASQHIDFQQDQGFSQGAMQTPENILTIVRASEAFPENADGKSVRRILANKLMIAEIEH